MMKFIVLLAMLTQVGFAVVEKLPVPRFVSLRSNKVNIHVGPGADFPIEWTFQRQGMPVEIIGEFDTWRQVRDMQGTTGWVHKSLLVGKRTAIVLNKQQKILRKAELNAPVVAYLEIGVIGKIKQCKEGWCRLDVKGYDGWIERKNIWGVYAHEEKF